MLKYRDYFILFGAVICIIEFMTLDVKPAPDFIKAAGVLHLAGSIVLTLTLFLYASTWKWGWMLFLRILLATFMVLINLRTYQTAFQFLSSSLG